MIEAGHANAAQNQAGGAPCVGGTTGQGMKSGGAANAVSVGSHARGTPHPTLALTGIIEGTKKSIAAINMTVTVFRKIIVAPSTVCGV